MDINRPLGRKIAGQLLGEAKLQQPAQPPLDDVDRRTGLTTVTARREVMDRHTFFAS